MRTRGSHGVWFEVCRLRVSRTAASKFVVWAPEDHVAHAKLAHGRRTHDARLDGDVQRGLGEVERRSAVVNEDRVDRLELRVTRRVARRDRPIVAAADHAVVLVDEDASDGHLARGERGLGLGKREAHVLVRCVHRGPLAPASRAAPRRCARELARGASGGLG